MSNLKEFKELIERYESITIEEIENAAIDPEFHGRSVAKRLTGFGTAESCPLCRPVNENCDVCLWWKSTGNTCDDEQNEDSYINIVDAEDVGYLLDAFKARAKYMRSILKD